MLFCLGLRSSPPLPLYILVVVRSYSRACLQLSRLISLASCFFIPLLQCIVFVTTIIAIIILLESSLIGFHRMSFSLTGANVCAN